MKEIDSFECGEEVNPTCSSAIIGSFFKTHFFNYKARANKNAGRESQGKTNNVVIGYSHNNVSPQEVSLEWKNDLTNKSRLQGPRFSIQCCVTFIIIIIIIINTKLFIHKCKM